MEGNKLFASDDPTPTSTLSPKQPRSGPVIWMGSPDDFEAVKVDGLLRSPSPDSEGEWNRRVLSHLNGNKGESGKEGKPGKKGESCGGKGKDRSGKERSGKGKGGKSSCDPWECKNGQLIGNGFDYDEDVAKTEKGQACKWWSGVKNERGYKYASTAYGFGSAERK